MSSEPTKDDPIFRNQVPEPPFRNAVGYFIALLETLPSGRNYLDSVAVLYKFSGNDLSTKLTLYYNYMISLGMAYEHFLQAV